jgi:hypothetical protein
LLSVSLIQNKACGLMLLIFFSASLEISAGLRPRIAFNLNGVLKAEPDTIEHSFSGRGALISSHKSRQNRQKEPSVLSIDRKTASPPGDESG